MICFIALDPRIFTAQYITRTFSPVSTDLRDQLPTEDVVLEQAEGLKNYVCNLRHDDGSRCGAVFSTLNQLTTHMSASKKTGHGVKQLVAHLCLDNQCLFCNTTFRTREDTVYHMARSYRQGRCIQDNTAQKYIHMPTSSL